MTSIAPSTPRPSRVRGPTEVVFRHRAHACNAGAEAGAGAGARKCEARLCAPLPTTKRTSSRHHPSRYSTGVVTPRLLETSHVLLLLLLLSSRSGKGNRQHMLARAQARSEFRFVLFCFVLYCAHPKKRRNHLISSCLIMSSRYVYIHSTTEAAAP